MEELANLFHGFAVALQPFNIGVMFLGIVLGVLIGVLPGLGGANGVAIARQLVQLGRRDHEASEHPGIGFLAIAQKVRERFVQRQAGGRKQAGVVDDAGEQGTKAGGHGGAVLSASPVA